MSDTLVLAEYIDQTVDLTDDDAVFIATRLQGRIRLHRPLRGSRYILNPRQWVGIVGLPSGRQLECRPKVPTRNLFAMLAAAYDLPDPFLDESAHLDSVADMLAFLAAYFAELVAKRLDAGLYRAYVEDEGNLASVRGRIAVVDDFRQNAVLRHHIYCRFSEYSFDVPENQVVRQVIQLLGRWGFPSRLTQRLAQLDGALEDVTPGRLDAEDLNRFVYHRLNEDYRPLHRLCQLFLAGSAVSHETGSIAFGAFLLDMNQLFEAFVTRALREYAPPGVTVAAQVPTFLDRHRTVPIRPDIVVRHDGRVVLVADCKYKRVTSRQHIPHDLYQVLAYCTAIGIGQGLLIYPRHLSPVDRQVTVRQSHVVIHEVNIDLGGTWEHLQDECSRIASIVRWDTGSAP